MFQSDICLKIIAVPYSMTAVVQVGTFNYSIYFFNSLRYNIPKVTKIVSVSRRGMFALFIMNFHFPANFWLYELPFSKQERKKGKHKSLPISLFLLKERCQNIVALRKRKRCPGRNRMWKWEGEFLGVSEKATWKYSVYTVEKTEVSLACRPATRRLFLGWKWIGVMCSVRRRNH